ncbi:MAG: hypothetical protein O3A80_01475 [bacterium]|nr:hypothetical protein [bacterium]MDA1292507.1 hypothetical protein [bacterium]
MTIDPFLIGLIGSAILIVGAAMPARTVLHPARSLKNWLFLIGSACMFGYAILHYLDGGSFFFVLLQILIAISTVLMMLNTDDRIDTPILGLSGVTLIAYALHLSHGIETIIFVIGLSVLGVGFALDTGTPKRNIALGVGSTVIAGFSYRESDWIFFGLNFFFAAFSFFHVWKMKTATKG